MVDLYYTVGLMRLVLGVNSVAIGFLRDNPKRFIGIVFAVMFILILNNIDNKQKDEIQFKQISVYRHIYHPYQSVELAKNESKYSGAAAFQN